MHTLASLMHVCIPTISATGDFSQKGRVWDRLWATRTDQVMHYMHNVPSC